MSNRKASELNKYLSNLTQLGFKKEDDKVVSVMNEIEKELDLINSVNQLTKDPSKSLVIVIKDSSSSMGNWENRASEEYYNLAINEIKNKYSDVEEIFIEHTTESKLVPKENFFTNIITGGTLISSAMKEVLNHLHTNREVIIIQFSDGDNFTADNAIVNKLLTENILPNVKYFKYVDINQYNRNSILMSSYKSIKANNFDTLEIKEKDDALKGLRISEELDKMKALNDVKLEELYYFNPN